MSKEVIRIRPFHYLHVKDTNRSIVYVVTGPGTFTCKQHEQVILGPEKMIVIPPSHYVVVENPVIRKGSDPNDYEKHIQLDESGQAKLRHGYKEIRFSQQPFPLYPGEKSGSIQPLQVVEENTALRLKANRDFTDEDGKRREAGESWLFYGRKTYYPRVEVDIEKTVKAVILKPDQALLLRASKDCIDSDGNSRRGGEEWIHSVPGAYLPGVHEKIVKTISAYVLTNTKALHVRAKATYTDSRKILRKAGTKWLVTNENYETFIPDVHEEVIAEVDLIVLNDNEYCIIQNPLNEDGVPLFGQKRQRKGPESFYLLPEESLENNIKQSILLSATECEVITATEATTYEYNGRKKSVNPGDIVHIYGPGEFIPPIGAKLKRVHAFLKIEPLGLYFFQPTYFFGGILLLLIFLYYFLGLFSSSTPEQTVEL
jgi:major vault protein